MVVRTGVVHAHLVDEFLIGGVNAEQDVFAPHQLHVETSLGLVAQVVHHAGQHDDEAVAGVNGFGGDTGEVGGFTALHVAHDQPLGLVDLSSSRVRQASDDFVGALIQILGCLLAEFLRHDLL
ncbi:hypothetical protein AUQ48_16555 [Kocuria flava]|uniref:Uncharacterized protein n=1 Tax=Kocuria flava TaxID=446860 RepID=A0A2N4SY64_9MICC|nr:hypothetical protein AUQ48_16555 [Kocuria flava]